MNGIKEAHKRVRILFIKKELEKEVRPVFIHEQTNNI